MKRSLIIVAAVLIAVGIAVFVAALAYSDFDLSKLDTNEYETKTYEIDTGFSGIEICFGETDITFKPSDDGSVKVVCFTRKTADISVSVEDGTLKITTDEKKTPKEWLTLFSRSLSATVYLPGGAYGGLKIEGGTGGVSIPGDFTFDSMDIRTSTGDVACGASASGLFRIKTGTGDIKLTNVSAGDMTLGVSTGRIDVASANCPGDVTLSVSTGKTRLSDFACGSLSTTGGTGAITLENAVVSGRLYIKRSTGDVDFINSDATEIRVDVSTGDVTGTLRSGKIFYAETSTGRIDLPRSSSGGKCEIFTSTGDVRIRISGE